ncbi:hypothetical protein J5N97_022294 [Dioscorea zingiberensis]|uniref:DNA-directed RNA polymerases I and III subunit RPAC2 n=1 Tax=Dioscorea zingiberensis TaxID=325984 RepID=A0A9D5CB96_9LILI|nr:hypothetical protein J5N97_022294 [Dioscorea zingiberensis]
MVLYQRWWDGSILYVSAVGYFKIGFLLDLVAGHRTPFAKIQWVMEHGSLTDLSSSTFSLFDEDHTLANSVRYTLNQDPRVQFTGYSIPHPSDNKVNIRVQTTGDPAKDVLKDALQNLMLMCKHVRTTFDVAVTDFKATQNMEHMNINNDQ